MTREVDAAIRLSFNPFEAELSPTEKAWRAALATGMESVLEAGAASLDDLVRGLNDKNVPDRAGRSWTATSLEAELSRLAW